jgi:phosphohistidine phosphatase
MGYAPPMRTIYLFRHGKSDWDAPGGSDRERALAPRGEKAARCMGNALARLGEAPHLVLTSPARRAIDTVRLAAEAGAWTCPVETAGLYGAMPDEVLRVVRGVDDTHERLLLAGHEPTWTDLVARLTGAAVRFPTAAIARIDVPAARWADVRPGTGTLVWFLSPRAAGKLTGQG